MAWRPGRPLPGSIADAAEKIEKLMALEEAQHRQNRAVDPVPSVVSMAPPQPAILTSRGLLPTSLAAGHAAMAANPSAHSRSMAATARRATAAARPDDCATCKLGCTHMGMRCARLCALFARSRLHLPICVAGCSFLLTNCNADCNRNLGCKPDPLIASAGRPPRTMSS
jgi:hypothetical protein